MNTLIRRGHPEIFICGDLAHVEQDGKQVPGVAQPAMQMGDYAAKRIARLLALERGSDGTGKDAAFRYFDKGDMATIGRKAAVAKIELALQGALERVSRVADLAGRAYLLPDRLSKPALRVSAVGLDVPDLQRRSAADHGKSGVAGVGHARSQAGRGSLQSHSTWVRPRAIEPANERPRMNLPIEQAG